LWHRHEKKPGLFGASMRLTAARLAFKTAPSGFVSQIFRYFEENSGLFNEKEREIWLNPAFSQ